MARAALAAFLACLVLAPLAHADGDPASDYLLTQSVFLPPDVVVPQQDAKKLTDIAADAKAKGYEIRVAVIGTRYDMGSVGALFRKPQPYARFLGQELRFVYKGRLLVVMPNGFGASQGGKPWPAAEAVVKRLSPPGTNGPALSAAAGNALRKVAAAVGGVQVAAPSEGGAGSGTTRTLIVVALLVVGGIAAAAILLGPKGVRHRSGV